MTIEDELVLTSDDTDTETKPAARRSRARAIEPTPAADERVWITLEENKGIPPRGQFFGLNGAGYILRPGKKALVPRGLVDILDAAVQMVPQVNPDTLQIDSWSEQLRFPYRLHNS